MLISRCQHPRLGPPHRAARPRTAGTGATVVAGRYRLTELVGRGGTAVVWRGRDELLDRDVAVKQFRTGHSCSVVEARLAGRVRHPHVAAVHDIVRHGDRPCLVMDYCGSTTLAALLRGGQPLPPPIVAALGLQLLDALRAVHAAGVVHCDVKPANLLIDTDGRLTLIDFGIAEATAGAPAHPARRRGDIVGSPAYLAPELVRGGAPEPAGDLWSLGATLYTAVEGHPPFLHDDALRTLAAVLDEPPAPARSAGRLQPLLARLLAKDPAGRPSYDEVHDMLTAACPAPQVSVLAARRAVPVLAAKSRTPGSRAHGSVGTLPYGGLPAAVPPAA